MDFKLQRKFKFKKIIHTFKNENLNISRFISRATLGFDINGQGFIFAIQGKCNK